MTVETQVDWQTLMTATLVPPVSRIAHVEPRAERTRYPEMPRFERLVPTRPTEPTPRSPECECPESCRLDHDNQ